MSSVLRLVWRQYRFEIIAAVSATLLLAVASVALAIILDGSRPDLEALVRCADLDDGSAECEAVLSWLDTRQTALPRLLGAAPLALALLLGAGLTSREIEHRTAQLGWSLSGARVRWLLERVVPVGALLVLLLVVLIAVSEYLERARYPGIDPLASLHDYGDRGIPFLGRGLVVFLGAALIGSIVGRQLPTFIVAGALTVALAYGLVWTFPYGTPRVLIPLAEVLASPEREISDRQWQSLFRASDGSVLDYDEAVAQAPARAHADDETDAWVYENFEALEEVLEGRQKLEVEARELLVLGGLSAVLLAGTVLAIDRRRPY